MAIHDNPYQTPQSVLTSDVDAGHNGNLDDALAGRYDFDIRAVLEEAWSKVPGTKRVFVLAGVAIFVFVMVATVVLRFVIPGAQAEHPGFFAQVTMQLALTVVIYPFMVGMNMLGIRRAAGLPIDVAQAFGYFHLVVPVAIAAVLVTVSTMIGFALLVLPGIYLSFAYLFTLPLIADKNLTPWQAMEASRRAVTHHWFKVFGLMVIVGLAIAIPAMVGFALFVVAAKGGMIFGMLGLAFLLVLFAAMLWAGPLLMIAIGILYRIIFGIEEETLRAF
ncbi:MAG: hypothetical protein HY749_02400 [Gammaproteobacteria bacterium]|nr:hypothetical protein [Gammaproteobacteria bacterium]MBI5615533.1 hypothetical protein [Gammaproteobacteria bacterium]